MKNKLKYGLTLAALAFLVGCSDKEGVQRPSVGSGSTIQDSSSIINSESANSNTSGTTSDSTSEIDPVELSNYQYYPLADKTWAITVGNNKHLEKMTLPEQYQGRKVTQIAEHGFKDCGALREISIPSSVLTIGNAAFSGCSALSNIAIPERVTTIGVDAFYGCSRLTICCKAQSKPSGWDDNWNSYGCPVVWGCIRAGNQDCFEYAVTNIEGVESATITGYAGSDTGIVVPKTIGGVKVTAIADLAFFRGCAFLTSIAIPDGVTTIGDYSFYGCSSLTSIVIPESMTSIGRFAFSGCTSLTSIVIPESVTSIGAGTFYDCSSLTICCQAQSKPSGWDKDWNYSNRPVVWGCSGIGALGSLNYRIDYTNGEESIIIFGCAGTDSEAVIPEKIGGIKVTAIADSAFKGRSSLTSIIIPEGVTTIGDEAFVGCTSLTSIVIPDSVTSIGNSAFSRCSSLTGIVIPDGVTNIGDSAFKGCSNLTICCKAKSEPGGWSSSWNPSYRPVVWGYIRAGDQDCFEYAVSSIDGVECATITGYAGSDTGIAVPETIGGIKVAAIANSAFAGCTFLTSIAIPDGVTNIGYAAFYGCSSLASIVIPEGVTNIGDYSFWGCSSLTCIAIPDGVTNIGYAAFCGCSSLASIAIPNSVTTNGDSSFWGCSSLSSIVIPEGATNIGDFAFRGCTSLASIVIPNSVTTIDAYAFSGCSSLTICCKAQSKPSGWDDNWNSYGCPVVWGYSGNGTSGSLN